ncbi:MAG: aa3-type cytochrome c oxidase subunit IV [Pseudomonadota bacterium]
MAEHEHGKMDISVQEKTFEGFIKWSAYGAIGAILALILIALINV